MASHKVQIYIIKVQDFTKSLLYASYTINVKVEFTSLGFFTCKRIFAKSTKFQIAKDELEKSNK